MTTPTDFMLIDVRSPGEYAGGHLEGSINVPLDEFTRRITELVPDKATPIVLCCASGARSGAAAGWLQQRLGPDHAEAANLGPMLADVQTLLGKVR